MRVCGCHLECVGRLFGEFGGASLEGVGRVSRGCWEGV